jgi:hypothetical protein
MGSGCLEQQHNVLDFDFRFGQIDNRIARTGGYGVRTSGSNPVVLVRRSLVLRVDQQIDLR